MDLEVWEDEAFNKIIEFLEVAVHNVVYSRHLYPSSSFASKQKYGTSIRMCTHPGVSGYIKNCLKGIQELFKTGEVESIHLVLVQQNSEPLESFVFDFSNGNESMHLQDSLLKELIEQFQNFCVKLGTSHSRLGASPSTSFRIELATTTETWQSIMTNAGDANFQWQETRPLEKLDPSNAVISPTQSFYSSFLSVRNIKYIVEAASQSEGNH